MKPSFTPGPWRVEKRRAPNGGAYYRIFDCEDAQSVIAQVIGDGRIEYHENARLIAAAPDLYAALSRILAAHSSGNCGMVMGEAVLCEQFAALASDAIAKANGSGD